MKKIFPAVWIGLISFGAISSIFSGEASSGFILLPVAMLVFGFFIFRHFVWDLADKVQDAGDYLIISKGGVDERVPLQNIINVSMNSFSNPKRLSLRMRKEGKFGNEVVFMPASSFSFNPFARNPVAEDLIVRVDRARSKK